MFEIKKNHKRELTYQKRKTNVKNNNINLGNF